MSIARALDADQRADALEQLGAGELDVLVVGGGVVGVGAALDAVMIGSPLARATEAPGRGFHWGSEATHADLPRGERVEFSPVGSLEEIMFGPSRVADGTMNLVGALRRAMATTGYTELKEFQRIEVVVTA